MKSPLAISTSLLATVHTTLALPSRRDERTPQNTRVASSRYLMDERAKEHGVTRVSDRRPNAQQSSPVRRRPLGTSGISDGWRSEPRVYKTKTCGQSKISPAFPAVRVCPVQIILEATLI
ncbi:hypothetical protein EVAR_89616_1 [Eumeta japonica]|uniref:Uncharacterized protein n=1 Tax=Eumeta variegata TaxID=151549 RepID=A0A4C1XN62_EUMVA|nr:hypothetical protein EVAR_89616_1 [Eumeta japonica]